SVTDLGSMTYGGVLASSSRIGRASDDPPGPHALTSISQLSTNNPQPRVYSYDANGNMLDIDGLETTWDFKDRLTAIANRDLRAESRYDHRDHRVTKKVIIKAPASVGSSGQTDSTIYVDQYFEVRQNGVATKYVWCGNTRVARLTGKLSADQRVQRL